MVSRQGVMSQISLLSRKGGLDVQESDLPASGSCRMREFNYAKSSHRFLTASCWMVNVSSIRAAQTMRYRKNFDPITHEPPSFLVSFSPV